MGTNPLLSKLASAVMTIPGLSDTLDTAPALTVFAAFDALGDQYGPLLADQGRLADTLRHHVVGRRYDAEGLQRAAEVPTLNTSAPALRITGTGDAMTVNGAKVLCGNIPTRNAAVFVVDTVLAPA
jgi:uncharacterized surface protein with fasciclin (FAS1) repeats